MGTWSAFMNKLKEEGTYESYKNVFESATLEVDKDILKKDLSLVDYAKSLGFNITRVGSNYRVEPCPVCGHRQHFSIAQNNQGDWYYNSFSARVIGYKENNKCSKNSEYS